MNPTQLSKGHHLRPGLYMSEGGIACAEHASSALDQRVSATFETLWSTAASTVSPHLRLTCARCGKSRAAAEAS